MYVLIALQASAGSYCYEGAHRGVVLSLAVTAENELITCGSDGCIRFWDYKAVKFAQVGAEHAAF